MTTLNLSVPERLREFVESQAVRKGFPSPDAYVLSLIEKERQAEVQARVEALLIEGLNSGPATEVNEEFWTARHRRLNERFPDQADS
ncbi:MAG TPA: hypothetical protein VFT74_05410 [Isosphaeraceae bacterium]|nr:hypothetical protein [Isosphaeraceae bacterium]